MILWKNGEFFYWASEIDIAGDVTIGGSLSLADDQDLLLGDDSDAALQYDTTQTPDSLLLGVPATSRALILCEKSDMGVDYGHGIQPNPTLFIQSADSGSPNQWIGFYHDQSNGVINVGSGGLSLKPSVFFENNIFILDNKVLAFGVSGDISIEHDSIFQQNMIGVTTTSYQLILCDNSHRTSDFGHAPPATPTFFVHSDESPGVDATEWASFAHNGADAVIGSGKGGLIIPEYTRHHDIMPSSAVLGPTAPSVDVQDTFAGLGFDADAEAAYLDIEVPDEWTGTSDMTLDIVWMPTSGDAIADTETVKWDIEYRSIAEGEAVDNGTVATATATYTQSGAGTDKELIKTEITLDYDGANQPLTVGDTIGIKFDRDVTGDTYSGKAIVVRWELFYTANRPGTH